MEFLLVIFEDERPVLINGEKEGKTNETLQIPAGTCYVSLESPPDDFTPKRKKVVLKNTTALSPLEVRFEKV